MAALNTLTTIVVMPSGTSTYLAFAGFAAGVIDIVDGELDPVLGG